MEPRITIAFCKSQLRFAGLERSNGQTTRYKLWLHRPIGCRTFASADTSRERMRLRRLSPYGAFPLDNGCVVAAEGTGFGSREDADDVVLSAEENRNGCGRYPFRVRTL